MRSSIGRKKANVFSPNEPAPFRYIHPYHLDGVKNMLLNPLPPNVRAVFLFGSSLELWCRYDSDLDLYFIVDNPISSTETIDLPDELQKIYRWADSSDLNRDILCGTVEDLMSNGQVLNTVENDVIEKGVCIYAR